MEGGLDESAESVLPGTVLDHFEVKEKIGQGGMGEVYLARDTRLDRLVALKFLPLELQSDAKARARLLREAKTVANLDHPFICKIHDFGEFAGETFISMEHVKGETLETRIARGAIPVNETVPIATEIADALAEAHERGIVHRDLKPSNIMLTRGGHVKVMDLGLAKTTSEDGASGPQVTVSSLTASHTVVGSLPYLSPEQARGEEVDARSDIFSLGCVLYEMLSGKRAFEGATPALLFDQILHHNPVPLRKHDPVIPENLDIITAKALAKDRELRYQSVDELMSDLRSLDIAGPDHKGNAPGRTAPQRLPSLLRPRIAAAAAIALLLVASLALWNVLAPRRSPPQETGGAGKQNRSDNSTLTEHASALASAPTQNPEAYDLFLRGRAYEQRSGWGGEDRKNARRMYEQALSLDPQFALARARLAMVARDPEEAKHALRQDPDLPEGHLAMAFLYFRYADMESALRELDLAEKGLPNSAEIAYWRARVANEQADWEKDLRYSEEAVKLEPRNPEYLFRLGSSLRKHNRYREAIAYYDRAIALAPDFLEAGYNSAKIHLQGFGDPEPMRKYLSELPPHITRIGGLKERPLGMKWWVEYYGGDYQAALNVLAEETFRNSTPLSNRWHLEGMTLYRMGQMESARKALAKARSAYEERLKSRPNDINFTRQLGVISAFLGEKDRAIEFGHRALELSRSHPLEKRWEILVWASLAFIYTLIGEYDQAFDYLDRVLTAGWDDSLNNIRKNPDFAELRRHPRWNDFERKHAVGGPAR